MELSSDDDDSEDVETLDQKQAHLEIELGVVGNQMEIHHSVANASADAEDHIEDFIEGKKEFDVNCTADNFRLMNSTHLTVKQKIAHLKSPDYCIETRADTIYLLLAQLNSLV